MPDLPISSLPSLATPEPTDVFAIVNSGITKKTTVQAVGNSVFTQISSSVILPAQTGSFTTTSSFNLYTGSVAPYYLSAYHTASIEMTGSAWTVYTMSYSTTDFAHGISISGSDRSKIKLDHSGIYDIQFSAQADKTNSSPHKLYIWLSKNGTNVDNSNTALTLFGGTNEEVVAAWNFYVSASSGDYYQLLMATDDSNLLLQYDPSPHPGLPAIPSIILTVGRIG